MAFSHTDLFRTVTLLAVGALAVVILVFWVGGRGVMDKIDSINPGYLLLAFCLEACFMLLGSLRWSMIIRAQGSRVPREIVAINFSGAFFNNITPISKTGGEPIRAYLLGKANGTSFEEGMAAVIVDRIFDMAPFVLICLVTFALIAICRVPSSFLLLVLILFGLLGAALVSVIIIAASLQKEAGLRFVLFLIGKLEPLIRRVRPVDDVRDRTLQALERFYQGTKIISKDKRLLAASVIISLLLWLTVILRLKMVFLSLGSNISLITVNIVAVASTFAGFVPLLPGGLGATEATMIALFLGFGVPRDVSGLAVFVDRIASFWFVTVVGAAASVRLSLKLKDMDQQGQLTRASER